MKLKSVKILIILVILTSLCAPVFAESLFRAGISQNAYPIEPRSLYSTVKARTIGDLVTILIDEQIKSTDNLKLDMKKSSDTNDNFSSLINKLIPRDFLPTLPKEVDNYGGSNKVGNTTKIERTSTFKDTITAQVVQIMPNGNLVVQGKKTAINAGEKVDIVVSGIIDPRLLDNMGRIQSNLVANLQVAMVGKGTVSRSGTEGPVNKYLRYLF